VGQPDKVEHEAWWNVSRRHQVGFLRAAFHTIADRALLDALVAADTAGGFLYDVLQTLSAHTQFFEVLLAPLVAEFQHRVLGLLADLDTLLGSGFDFDYTSSDSPFQKGGALIAARFHKSRLTGFVADDSPIPAGEIGLPGDLQFAAAAVRSPPEALFLELVHGDALVAPLVLDDELAFVDLFLVDGIGNRPRTSP